MPQLAFVTNNTLDFSIVAVPSSFAELSSIAADPPTSKIGAIQPGDTLLLQHNTADVDRGNTESFELVVTGTSDNEIFCSPRRSRPGNVTLGSPLYNARRELVGMMVRPCCTHGEDGASLRAVRIDALLERLRKRSQSEDALGADDGGAGGGGGPSESEAAVIRRRRARALTPLRAAVLAAVAAVAVAMILWDVARMRARTLAR